MANVVEVVFKGNDKVTPVLKNISSKTDALANDLSSIGEPFAAATKKVLLFQAAIVGIGVMGLKASADLESEVNKMVKSLNLPIEKVEEFKEVAVKVFSAGYGEDIADSFDIVTAASKKFANLTSQDLETITTKTLQLTSVFDTDYTKVLGAVNTLMTQFGLTSDEAFNFVASGFQKGLNGAGDFVDSINEYSTQFANSGADAGAFFSILETGFQEGMLGTDKAADMFKEFRVRIQDGSKLTAESLALIGIDNNKLQTNLNDGTLTVKEAFDIIIHKLEGVNDASILMQAGVGLAGTQFEDLGTKAALSLSTTKTKVEDLKDAFSRFDTADFNKSMKSAWRTTLTGILGMSEWDDLKRKISVVVDDMVEEIGPALKNIDTSGLMDSIDSVINAIGNIFKDMDMDLTTMDGMTEAIQFVIDSVGTLTNVVVGMIDVITPILEFGQYFMSLLNELDPEIMNIAGIILMLGTALTGLASIVAIGGALISGISVVTGLFSAGGALAGGLSAILALLTGPVGIVVGLTALAGVLAKFTFDHFTKSNDKANKALEENNKTIQDFNDNLAKIPHNVKSEIQLLLSEGKIDEAQKLIDKFKDVEINASINEKDVNKSLDKITKDKNISIQPTLEELKNRAKVEAQIKSLERSVKIGLDNKDALKKAKIMENTAKKMQSVFQYKAKVEIAQAKAAAEVLSQAFESAGGSVDSLSKTTGSMFGDLIGGWDKLKVIEKMNLMDLVEDEQNAQNKALESQMALNKAQTEYMEAKTESLEKGDQLITIDSTGLEPSLELVMWNIIEKVQLRANAESVDFLLGI